MKSNLYPYVFVIPHVMCVGDGLFCMSVKLYDSRFVSLAGLSGEPSALARLASVFAISDATHCTGLT